MGEKNGSGGLRDWSTKSYDDKGRPVSPYSSPASDPQVPRGKTDQDVSRKSK